MSYLSEALSFGFPDWMDDAACQNNVRLAELGLTANSWHPDSYKTQRTEVRAAINVCKSCPVATKCLTYAIENGEQHGIWGSTTEGQRYELIRKAQAKEPCNVGGCDEPRARRSDDKGCVSTCHTHHYRPARHDEVAS